MVVASLLAPSVATAQSERAGVVTTLEGNVTARRVALPDPVPLKFKDDIFLRDTVTTGDRSIARILLGGKAVVTVRERSVLTITEVPGRSTIELDSGKFALAVAREKMRPGEEIQIRTPNAIAGVRGTVVITEVNRQSAQVRGGAPAVLTNFYVLRGRITAQPLDFGSRQPLGIPLNVGAMQSYSGAAAAAPRVAPVAPAQVKQITSGLAPTGVKDAGGVGKEQAKSQAVQTTVALLSTITGTKPTGEAGGGQVAPAEKKPSAASDKPPESTASESAAAPSSTGATSTEAASTAAPS
ncbi:MAG: FecR domain-containing protein, partial [Candidatus Rokubacteria bacterium]|nr:FecR domain-containing protein [Candidatus Rokubacteria bacterium]